MTEEKRRKYDPPLAGMAQYERPQEEAPNVMPEIDLPQAEQQMCIRDSHLLGQYLFI